MDPECFRTCACVWREMRKKVKRKVAALELYSIISLKENPVFHCKKGEASLLMNYKNWTSFDNSFIDTSSSLTTQEKLRKEIYGGCSTFCHIVDCAGGLKQFLLFMEG